AERIFEIAFHIAHGHTVGVSVSEKIYDLVAFFYFKGSGLFCVGLYKSKLNGLGGRCHGHIEYLHIISVIHIYKVGLYLGLGHKGTLAFYSVKITFVNKFAYGLSYGCAAYAVYVTESFFCGY